MVAVTPRLPPAGMRLNTGRVRDQWHTMTRSGRVPRLSAQCGEPFVEIHPRDAAALGLKPAGLASLRNNHGHAVMRVVISDRVAPGQPFAPIHWGDANGPSGRVGALVPACVDPISGQPALKQAALDIAPFAADWYGFAVAARPFRPDCRYWATAPMRGGMRAEMAGTGAVSDWLAWARRLFGLADADAVVLDDRARGIHRIALTQGGRVVAALFVGAGPLRLARDSVAAMIGTQAPAMLAGAAPADRPDPGPTVCACLGVGRATIERAIRDQRLTSTAQLTACLGAGGNCGACLPDLRALLAASQRPAPG